MLSLARSIQLVSAAALCLTGTLVVGCASKNQPYPTPVTPTVTAKPSMPAPMPTPPPPPTPPPAPSMSSSTGKTLVVPAGAREVAAGSLPLPAFYAPPEGGMLYIVDINTGTVAKITSYGPMPSGGGDSKALNLSDLPNATNNLDPTHKFRVYYVPASSATSLPSTLPSTP